jgi:hypothetical protein
VARRLSIAATSALAVSGRRSVRPRRDSRVPADSLAPIHHPATALELPYRVIRRWPAAGCIVEPFASPQQRTELWHTRLTTARHDFGPDASSKVRSIWSPDYPLWGETFSVDAFVPLLEPPPKPFRMSLDPLDRAMLVRLMAGFTDTRDGQPYHPRASRAAALQLSALGGSLAVEGNWAHRPDGVDLEQWRHIASLGRDQYVRGSTGSCSSATPRRSSRSRSGSSSRSETTSASSASPCCASDSSSSRASG